MQFEVFENQYEQFDLELIPFSRDKHCRVNYCLELIIHQKHPYLIEIEKAAQRYAKSIKARFRMKLTNQMDYLQQPFMELHPLVNVQKSTANQH